MSNETPIALARIKRIMHKLAFSHESMDESSRADQEAFYGLWDKFTRFMTVDGIHMMISVSKHWTDAEVAILCLALVRSMEDETKSRLTGVHVMGSMVFVSAVPCCSELELGLARSIATGQELKLAADNTAGGAESDKIEERLARMIPSDRSHLVTSEGNVIDLTEVFKRGGK